MKNKIIRVAFRTTLIYWAFSLLWILFSDRAVMKFSSEPAVFTALSTYKGWGFVTATAVLLYTLLHRQLNRWQAEMERRREAEKALGHYEMLANHARDLILFVRLADGRIIEANAAAVKAYGYSRKELLSLSINDLRFPAERNLTAEQMSKADEGGILFETTHVRKDGSTFPVEVSSQGMEVDGARTLVSVIREITDRKRAEEQLLIKNSAIESSISAIGLADLSGKIFYVNEEFVKLWGCNNEGEIIGKDISEFSHSLQKMRQAVDFMKAGKGYLDESEGVRKNGERFDFQISANTVKSENGDPICMMASFIDITERKQVEQRLKKMYEELKDSEEKYRSLFEQSKDAIFMSEPDGSLVDVNPAAVELLGFASKDDLIGVHMADLFAEPNDSKSLFDALRRDRFAKDQEFMFKKKNGEEIRVSSTTTVVLDESRQTFLFLGIVRDITKQKALQQQLIQAQRMESVGTLAAGIAHDFNNLLGIIMGYSAVIEKGTAEPDKIARSVDTIQKATARGASLVRQLVTFAQKGESVFERVQINDVVNETTKLLRETLPRTITIATELKPDLPPIDADATQIQQVLLNLCVNARDAMPGGGTVRIVTTALEKEKVVSRFPNASSKGYIFLEVTDTGTGMDEETKRRIFDPFFTTKDVGKGTGLGLSLVHSIVSNHGGFVDVDTSPGAGTTFGIYLPIEEQKAEHVETAVIPLEDVPGGTETILVIEDEEMLRELVKTVIEFKGYHVITACDGEEGIEIFKRKQSEIALVISDLGLPKFPGDEVLRRIRSLDPAAKLVAASGFVESDVRMRLLNLGVERFVQKPYLPSEILQTIRGIIDGNNSVR
ncbi:MAG TPA: PAS domain S-box protein [Candidatus Acidoferrales bacterium]|nr:PAS domain S-box protein [Candidatus Acidoferrales bacterium]